MKRVSLIGLILMLLSIPAAQAAEPLPQAVQDQLASLTHIVKSLESTVHDLRATVHNQNEVIQQQHIRINALEGGKKISPAIPDAPVSVAGISQGFNPNIGVVGTVQAHLTESSEDAEGKDTIALKELEISFSQYVDPYSRLDAIIAFNDNLEEQNVDIEEAYYTHWGLPYGFTGRIGKFRSNIGKQNQMHLHQLDTVDYALVIRDFFGEEGFAASGIRLQNMIPNPWDIPIELSGEVLRGNNGASFSGISRRPIFNTHLKTFFELNDDMSLELGSTAMFGDENRDGLAKGSNHFDVAVFGGDATFLWQLEQDRALKWQTEVYWQDRPDIAHVNTDPWGFYSLLDFRFADSWSAGIRFDYLEPLDVVGEHNSTVSVSPYLTLWQSEFANFRLQYTHTQDAAAVPDVDNEQAVFLQANFLIGDHSHPVS